MAPRTLASTWRQLERLAKRYEAAPGSKDKALADLAELCGKINSSRIVGALGTLFVQGYPGLEETVVAFVSRCDGVLPDWVTSYCAEEDVLRVSPVGVLRFNAECSRSVGTLTSPEAREDFCTYRYHAYLAQLSKLPTQHVLFLQLLKEVGNARRITDVERKGGGTDSAEDEQYMTLLWAFNELEKFMSESSGLSLRSEYGISWYESDWFVGPEKKGGRSRK